MSQDITVIECKKIIAAKSGKKGLNNNVLDQLNDSISREGLFNPITVRPAKDKPGFYMIVAGEHRYYVVAKMMKEESIECRVFADMSDEEAELAALSENACRVHNKTQDRLLALRKWQEVYAKRYPELMGRRAGATSRWTNSTKADAKQAAVDEEKAQDAANIAEDRAAENSIRHSGGYSDEATVEAVEPEAAEKSKPDTFNQRVQKVTGATDRTLARDLKIARGLTEDQIYVLGLVQCTKMGMLKIINATEDLGKRGEIANLVASGMEVELAIKEVLGITTTKDEAGRVKEVDDKPAESAATPALSDDEWFERECREFSSFLTETDQYRSDAILYRRISEARTKFRKSVKKIVEDYREERRGKKVGWLFPQLHRILNLSHPKDWNICIQCGGKSLVDPGVECPKCKGACYETKTERY